MAQKYLTARKIPFVTSAEFGEVDNDRVEVIFLTPEMLDPNVVTVDPPDIRVWVNRKTGEVELIPQM